MYIDLDYVDLDVESVKQIFTLDENKYLFEIFKNPMDRYLYLNFSNVDGEIYLSGRRVVPDLNLFEEIGNINYKLIVKNSKKIRLKIDKNTIFNDFKICLEEDDA